MDDVKSSDGTATRQREGSTMRRFLAERGVIIMKENHAVAKVRTTHGAALEIGAQVLVVIKNDQRKISAGIRMEQEQTSVNAGSVGFVDSDEIEELSRVLHFLSASAGQMGHDARDYTEVIYSTRDDVTVGFFQQAQKQQAFVKLGGTSSIFFALDALRSIRNAILEARDYVAARRVAWESR